MSQESYPGTPPMQERTQLRRLLGGGAVISYSNPEYLH